MKNEKRLLKMISHGVENVEILHVFLFVLFLSNSGEIFSFFKLNIQIYASTHNPPPISIGQKVKQKKSLKNNNFGF